MDRYDAGVVWVSGVDERGIVCGERDLPYTVPLFWNFELCGEKKGDGR